jgi:signal recognition particle GTPase
MTSTFLSSHFFLHSSTAKKTGTDVVLIDTAGRMQDNEPLMKALSKVSPDLHSNCVFFLR